MSLGVLQCVVACCSVCCSACCVVVQSECGPAKSLGVLQGVVQCAAVCVAICFVVCVAIRMRASLRSCLLCCCSTRGQSMTQAVSFSLGYDKESVQLTPTQIWDSESTNFSLYPEYY